VKENMKKRTLLYICGSGHSGSTLLDRMLGNHSDIAALGEAHRLFLNANKLSKPHYCACGKHVLECSFWKKVSKGVQEELGVEDDMVLKKLITTDPKYLEIPDDVSGLNLVEDTPPKLYQSFSLNRLVMLSGSLWLWTVFAKLSKEVSLSWEAIQNSLLIYDVVRSAFNTPVVVDGTKTPGRLMGLYLQDKESFKALYLCRDGRAVTLSRMKRQGLTMRECAQHWVREHQKLRMVLRHVPKEQQLRMHYEDLCVNPEQELRKICAFLEIDFEDSTLNIRSPDIHSLGGNNMRWRNQEDTIAFDEKWRSSLSNEDLKVFEEVAGSQNRLLGYAQ